MKLPSIIWIVIVVFAAVSMAFATKSLWGMGGVNIENPFGGGAATPGTGGYSGYYGTLTIAVNEANWNDGAAETTTSPVYTFYRGAIGRGPVSITASGTDVNILPEDKGIGYLKCYSGTAHYVDVERTRSANPRILEAVWNDVDGDGYDSLLFKIDLSGIGLVGQGLKPVYTLSLQLFDEDVSGLTDDSPAAMVVGHTETVKTVTWKFSGLSEKAGCVISRIYVTTNETYEGTDIALEGLDLSGWGISRTWSRPARTVEGATAGDYAGYYLDQSDWTELHGNVLYAQRGVNKADAMYVSLNVRCKLEAADDLQVVINIVVLDSANAETALTDTVELNDV